MVKALMVAAALVGTSASAQVNVQMQVGIPLPTIVFPAPPPLVVVEPGVQVVEDYDDEVFFVDGWYWTRRDNSWFRTRRHDGHWVVVDRRYVHPKLLRYQVGHYRHWRRHGHGGGPVMVVPVPGPGQPVHRTGPVPGGHFKRHYR
ncbi:MAG: hypothetical protein K1X64_18795 [Myxococcaceae bacterium]|nr:hypothetical protein [Myxococcaceae bacterium]